MWFDKNTSKVILETLTKVESRAYISFLQEEEERHIVCLNNARERARAESARDNDYWKARGKFWESAVKRHLGDISDIKALIEKVEKLFE